MWDTPDSPASHSVIVDALATSRCEAPGVCACSGGWVCAHNCSGRGDCHNWRVLVPCRLERHRLLGGGGLTSQLLGPWRVRWRSAYMHVRRGVLGWCVRGSPLHRLRGARPVPRSRRVQLRRGLRRLYVSRATLPAHVPWPLAPEQLCRQRGSTCREPRCLHNCSGASGHGTCAGPNRCRCAAGWSGADCSEAICDEPCGAHGKCIGANRCACDAGWKGARCDVPECSSVMYFRARARDGASRGLRGRRRSGGRRHRHRAGPRAGLLRRRCV